MKKVLLINTNTEKNPYPVAPLGIGMIAQALKDHYEVRVFDRVFNSSEKLLEMIPLYAPDYIGFGIRNIDDVMMGNVTYYVPEIVSLIRKIREVTKAPLILGGSGYSLFPEEILRDSGADYGIIGEGEEVFLSLLKALENKTPVPALPQIVLQSSAPISKGRVTPLIPSISPSDSNLYEWIDFNPYLEHGAYPIQTKRGCVFECIYCSYPYLEGNRFRLRKPSLIVNEMQEVLEKSGITTFEFVDSTFNSPLSHAEEICREIISRRLKVTLRTMGVNPGQVTERLLELMRSAGFDQIDCTPDTASPSIIRNMKKNFTYEELVRCADIIRKVGMPTIWFFMFGGPGETEETVLDNFRFIDEYMDPQDMAYLVEGIRILPHTALREKAIEEGVIRETDSLYEPVFYISPTIERNSLALLLRKESRKRNHVIHGLQGTPLPWMIEKAVRMREEEKLKEPMFRTLLRIRDEFFSGRKG